MIIHEEWDKFRLYGPVPYRYPLYLMPPSPIVEPNPAIISDMQELHGEFAYSQEVANVV